MYLLAEISCIQVIIEITCLSKSFDCLRCFDSHYKSFLTLTKSGKQPWEGKDFLFHDKFREHIKKHSWVLDLNFWNETSEK